MAEAADILFEGADEQQVEMMEERVIVIDEDDRQIGHASKKESHLMENINAGMLHRAFSVFLFTPDNRLILQQRASTKITFPDYWANTCCSHPLYVDAEREETNHMGVKRAAQRKLQQELGIDPAEVPLSSFKFLTRVHYVAGCDGTVWGEHEIDHILICTPGKTPTMHLNENEVQATRSFTRSELRAWVSTAEERGDLISPWFRIIEQTLLPQWWEAMDNGHLDDFVELDVIHRADDLPQVVRSMDEFAAKTTTTTTTTATTTTPAEAEAEASKENHALSAERQGCKQGGYGKIPTHKESVLSQLMHVDEVWAAVVWKAGLSSGVQVTPLPADAPDEQRWCEDVLDRVSRSFAMVIKQLPPRLRRSVTVFYLVLRGLDTVEDDMETFSACEEKKLEYLRAFHTYLELPEWSLSGVGEGDERALLEAFTGVLHMYQRLPAEDRRVISDVCARMGDGMARFAGRDLTEGTEDIGDYNLYCHYVAGLVGEGLSRLFASAGLEDQSLARQMVLANEMGLFLQKTNIIRDYLEDHVEGRAFWPKEIWGQYAESLGHVHESPHALECLNHMVADAMRHAPNCLRYMSLLHDPDVLRFCAIPQVMAIATLEKVCNNPDVFTGVVKIRKGLAVKLIQDSQCISNVYSVFLRLTRSIAAKIPASHAVAHDTMREGVRDVETICLHNLPPSAVVEDLFSSRAIFAVLCVFAFLLRHLYLRSDSWDEGFSYVPRITDSSDVAALAALVGCGLYLSAFTYVPLMTWLASPGGSPPPSPLQKPQVGSVGVPTLPYEESLGKPAYTKGENPMAELRRRQMT